MIPELGMIVWVDKVKSMLTYYYPRVVGSSPTGGAAEKARKIRAFSLA